MLRRIWKRPSTYVALCAGGLITLFVWRGDLRIEQNPSRSAEAAVEEPKVVHSNLPAPPRTLERVTLTGRVTDALGNPLAGAEVSDGTVSVQAAADGTFALATAKASYADLAIVAEGFRRDLVRTSAAAPDALVVQLEPSAPWDRVAPVAAPAPALHGEGTVRDREGQPVTGAFVTEEGSGLWSRTDDIGRYTLALSGSIVRLLVHRPATDDSPALAARSEPITLSRTRGNAPLPEIIVDQGGSIHGILRSRDGSPAVGVPVVVRGAGAHRVCESGISGHFHVDGLVPGDYDVTPLAWNGSVGRSAKVHLTADKAVCDLALEPVARRKVQVRREDGAAVANAIVASLVDGRRCFVARADPDGWAEVGLLDDRTGYEVRGAGDLEPFVVQRLDQDTAQLIVALP